MQAKSVFPLLPLLIGIFLVCTAANAGDLGSCLTSMGVTQGDVVAGQRVDGLGPFAEREVDHIDTLWWTGNIDQHIFAGQTLSWQPDLPQTGGVLMQIKYGLWNSPDVYMDVRINSQLLGTLVAHWGYISPGPRYALANISNYIMAGPDLIEITAQPGGGEAVIGFVAVGARSARETTGSNPLQILDGDCSRLTVMPNPFNPSTAISYQLPENSYVRLQIHDVAGRLVAELVNGWREAGSHQVTWNATDMPSGIYFAEFSTANHSATQKLLLTK